MWGLLILALLPVIPLAIYLIGSMHKEDKIYRQMHYDPNDNIEDRIPKEWGHP